MKIRIIKGTNQIGGTITEITSSKGTKILIDFGKDLDTDVTDIPKIDWKEYHAVFITHNHEDHIGLINNIPDDVLVYVEETSLEVYQVFLDFTSKLPLSRKINTFKINEEIKINDDIIVKSYITDHSAFNALMFLIECDDKKVLHTGDFRTNGYKGKLVEQVIKEIKSVDVVVMEGTTLSRNNLKNRLEKNLVKDIYDKTKKYDKVLILQSSTNIDRVVSMYKAMKKSKKIFIEDIFTANITTLLSKKGYTIPNPKTFYDVYSFVPMNRSEYRKDHKTDFYYQYIEPFKKDAHLVMTKEKFGILVKQSMLKDIKLYYNKGYLKNTCLIYSMWEGYKEKEDTNRFLKEIGNLGIDIITCHTSGHSDEAARKMVLKELTYRYLIPIHTEQKEKFEKYKHHYILNDGEELEIR